MKKTSIMFLIILLFGGFYTFNVSKKSTRKTIEIERTYKADDLYDESDNTELVNEEVSKTSIEIINYQNDQQKEKYTYNITIRDVTGATRYSVDGVESYAVFSSNGEATITINSNQKIIIYDIPYNTYYSIEQASNSKYVTSVDNKNQNIIEGVTAQNNIVTFNNTNKVVSANPSTADYSIMYIVSAILSLIALIVLIKTVKVKRFTNL